MPTTAALTPRIIACSDGPLAECPERQRGRQDQDAGQKNADEADDRAGNAMRGDLHDGARIGREGKERAGRHLRGTLAVRNASSVTQPRPTTASRSSGSTTWPPPNTRAPER